MVGRPPSPSLAVAVIKAIRPRPRARPSARTSGKTLRMRPKFHLDGLFSRGSTFQSVTSHQMSRMMSSCIRKKSARGLNLDLRLDSSPASCLPGGRLSRLTDLLRWTHLPRNGFPFSPSLLKCHCATQSSGLGGTGGMELDG